MAHLVRRLGVVRLELKTGSNLASPVRGELSTRSQRGRRRARSIEDRQKDSAEELVELHLVAETGLVKVCLQVEAGELDKESSCAQQSVFIRRMNVLYQRELICTGYGVASQGR